MNPIDSVDPITGNTEISDRLLSAQLLDNIDTHTRSRDIDGLFNQASPSGSSLIPVEEGTLSSPLMPRLPPIRKSSLAQDTRLSMVSSNSLKSKSSPLLTITSSLTSPSQLPSDIDLLLGLGSNQAVDIISGRYSEFGSNQDIDDLMRATSGSPQMIRENRNLNVVSPLSVAPSTETTPNRSRRSLKSNLKEYRMNSKELQQALSSRIGDGKTATPAVSLPSHGVDIDTVMSMFDKKPEQILNLRRATTFFDVRQTTSSVVHPRRHSFTDIENTYAINSESSSHHSPDIDSLLSGHEGILPMRTFPGLVAHSVNNIHSPVEIELDVDNLLGLADSHRGSSFSIQSTTYFATSCPQYVANKNSAITPSMDFDETVHTGDALAESLASRKVDQGNLLKAYEDDKENMENSFIAPDRRSWVDLAQIVKPNQSDIDTILQTAITLPEQEENRKSRRASKTRRISGVFEFAFNWL